MAIIWQSLKAKIRESRDVTKSTFSTLGQTWCCFVHSFRSVFLFFSFIFYFHVHYVYVCVSWLVRGVCLWFACLRFSTRSKYDVISLNKAIIITIIIHCLSLGLFSGSLVILLRMIKTFLRALLFDYVTLNTFSTIMHFSIQIFLEKFCSTALSQAESKNGKLQFVKFRENVISRICLKKACEMPDRMWHKFVCSHSISGWINQIYEHFTSISSYW